MGHLVVAESHGEWDGLCAGDFSETTRTLAIGKSGKDGFASLRVTEVSSARQRVLKGDDDCQDIRGEPRTTLFSLDYDGRRYEVPKGLVYQ